MSIVYKNKENFINWLRGILIPKLVVKLDSAEEQRRWLADVWQDHCNTGDNRFAVYGVGTKSGEFEYYTYKFHSKKNENGDWDVVLEF